MKGEQLGAFEELVLLAVHGLGDEAYGIAVQQVLERETDRSVSLGPVNTVLDRLEAKASCDRRRLLARRRAAAAAAASSR